MGNTPVKQITEFNRTPGAAEHLKVVYYDNDEKRFKYRNPNDHIHDYDKYEYWTIEMPNILQEAVRYGSLYNYPAVIDARNIAPLGWHVPAKSEIETLITECGGINGLSEKLRETGDSYWTFPNEGATNEFGLNIRGDGYRDETGTYDGLKEYAQFYSATNTGGYPWVMQVNRSNTEQLQQFDGKSGFGIRLVKDDSVDDETMTGNDGKVYRTVKIGNQVWMAENSAETKYRTGDLIDIVSDETTWAGLATGALCFYNNDPANVLMSVSVPGDSMNVLSKQKVSIETKKGIEVSIVDGKLKFSYNSFYTDNGIPYVDTISALSKIVSTNRYVGLTVKIGETDYWFGTGIEDVDLVQKPYIAHVHSIGEITNLSSSLSELANAVASVAEEVDGKVDKATGMGLSHEDFTSEEKAKLANQSGINTGDQTLDGLQGVKRPQTSEANAAAVFTDNTGTEVKSSKLFVDNQGQMRNEVTPDENGYAVGDETVASGSESYGKVAAAEWIPLLSRNMGESGSGERNAISVENTLIHNSDGSLVVPENGFAFFDQYRFPHKRGGDPRLSLQGQKHVVKYTDVTPGAECIQEEWYVLKNGVLTLAMWLNADGLHTNNSIFSQSVYDITLPSAASVSGRIPGAVFGSGAEAFSLSVPTDSYNHLIVTHNLNREIAGVTVKATFTGGTVNGKRLLTGNNAYSGWIALDKNTLRIENLATDLREITLHLLFS